MKSFALHFSPFCSFSFFPPFLQNVFNLKWPCTDDLDFILLHSKSLFVLFFYLDFILLHSKVLFILLDFIFGTWKIKKKKKIDCICMIQLITNIPFPFFLWLYQSYSSLSWFCHKWKMNGWWKANIFLIFLVNSFHYFTKDKTNSIHDMFDPNN